MKQNELAESFPILVALFCETRRRIKPAEDVTLHRGAALAVSVTHTDLNCRGADTDS